MNSLLAQSQSYKITGPGLQPYNNIQATYKAETIISQIIGVLTIVAAIWFLIQIILAGYAFMSAEGDKNKMETARKRLTDGVLGITIIVLAVTLVGVFGYLAGVEDILSLTSLFGRLGL